MDQVFIVLSLLFFLLTWGFIVLCERV